MILLRVEWMGRALRYTTGPEPVVVDGWTWQPGLAIGAIELHTLGSLSVELLDGRDWAGALLAARGAPSAPCTVWWSDGVELVGLAAGRMVAAAVGGAGTGSAWRVECRRVPGTRPVPDPAAAITAEAWPVSDPSMVVDQNVEGTPYPVVYGYPGLYGSYGGDPVPGPATPAYLAEYSSTALLYGESSIVIAGHPVQAVEVRLHQVSGGAESRGADPVDVVPVEQVRDALGRTVSVVRAADCDQVVVQPGGEYWVDWAPDRGGGMPDPLRGGPLRGGDHVVAHVLGLGGYPVSVGRLGSLDWLLVDAVLTEPEDALDWVAELVSELGGTVHRDEVGVYARLRSPSEAPALALTLDGRTVERTSDLAWPDGPGAAEVRVDFGLLLGSQYVRRVRLVAEDDGSDGQVHALCLQALHLYGPEVAQVSLPWLYDAATAQVVAGLLAELRCLPGPSVEVEVSDPRLCLALARLGLGAVVEVVDGGPDPIGWGTRSAWVERVSYTPGGCSVVLRLR